MEQSLCRADEIAEGEAKGFVLGSGQDRIAVFVLRHEGSIRGYVNACPHQGTPLEIFPDRFFDALGRNLICRTHGALFRPEDGFCVAGPCAGKSLKPAPIRVADGKIWFEAEESRD
jgi:nitrite reductase/ring-hydroxylating ferredoxin subunit